jgi:hypothetical protein
MSDDWQLSPQHEEILIKAGDISAAIRNADDAGWDLNDDLSMTEPFDPFADDPE